MRTPLYIPTIKTPPSEARIAEEGELSPEIVQTAEFAVPPAPSPVDSSTVAADLPWIDAFLAATPAVSLPAIQDDAPALAAQDVEPVEHMRTVSTSDTVSEVIPAESAPLAADEQSEAWPLDEAAAEFHALSSRLEPASPQAPGGLFSEAPVAPSLPPLPAWSDDEFMDIMPVRQSDQQLSAESPASMTTPLAPTPRSVPAAEATAEEAARALEVLARRVREGELALPGYDPRMGEPAALVAALAALLGVRLR